MPGSDSRFLTALQERVLVLDGATGTSLHAHDLPLSDYRGLENCVEVLTLTRPDVVANVHASFLEVGCDAVQTNTFGGSRLVLAEFGLAARTREINRQAAQLARSVCTRYATASRPRFVIGSLGPGTKLPSLGHVTWDVLLDSFTEQAWGLIEGGVDALLVETCQDILQAKCAVTACLDALGACGVELPILCSLTVETTGTMLVGTETLAALVALDAYPQVRVIGLNCATGPQEMSEHVRVLSRHSTRPILVQPNAGLPELVDGCPHYVLTPAELARWLREFVEVDGVGLVGGCCGTTPAHLRAVVEAIGTRPPQARNPRLEPSCSSLYAPVTLRQENAILAVGERTNANGSKKFRELLVAGDVDGMVQMGREQLRQGSHVLDVCTAYTGRDEAADMRALIRRFAVDVVAPLMIDSTEPPVLEAALQLCGGKCIVNSINLEDGAGRLETVCRLARRYGAAVVALTIDESGMAKTAAAKLAVARRIRDLAVDHCGLRAEDLLFDALTFTLATGQEDDRRLGLETLEGIRLIKAELPGVHAILGVSNISFGLNPAARRVINSVFLHYAGQAGLDAAIVHSSGIVPLYKIDAEQRRLAEDLIFDRRTAGYDPLGELVRMFAQQPAAAGPAPERSSAPVEERLRRRIIEGDRVDLESDLHAALERYAPLAIINEILLEGMKTVGELFGSGQMQLPFVLQSAETMKAAVAFLEPRMEKSAGQSKGVVVLATVRGDVHDIGKNLVDIILTNNGYKVHNLGIKQPINSILEAWEKHGAQAIGMSGLLVKSTVVMRENLQVMRERGIAAPVILGGAALTRRFVEEDLRAEYDGPLYYAGDAFDGLNLMNTIMGGSADARSASRRPVACARPAPEPADSAVRSAPSSVTAVAAAAPRGTIRPESVPAPVPPFWGPRVVEQVPLRAVLAYLNEKMLFNVQWQYHKGRRAAGEYRRFVQEEVRPVYRDLVARCESEGILQPRVVYGYWPCVAEGDALVVLDPADQGRELVRFEFPRQKKEPFRCLSDFFHRRTDGEPDVVAFTAVTVGAKASEIARQWFAADRYRDYLHLHGLSVETAEALAEYMHKRVRVELGIAADDARDIPRLFQQKYRGSRYSFGYPACPHLEDQLKLWPLLDPGRIGVTITEDYQLVPEQSTTALICHHPQAKYFNVR